MPYTCVRGGNFVWAMKTLCFMMFNTLESDPQCISHSLQGEVTCSMQGASCMTEDDCGGVLEWSPGKYIQMQMEPTQSFPGHPDPNNHRETIFITTLFG